MKKREWSKGRLVPRKKIAALFGTHRIACPFQSLKHVLPDLSFLRKRLVPKQVSRMIGGHQRNASVSLPGTSKLADSSRSFAQ